MEVEMKLINGGIASLAVTLSLAACGGSSNTGGTTPAAGSTSTAASTSKTVPSGAASGTKSLDLSGGAAGVPITMKAAPANAVKSAASGGGGVLITGDQMVMNVTTDSRTLAQAKQSITSGAEGATFVRLLVDESDALLYEAKEGGGADTYLVYVAPSATPGYVCVSPTLAVSKNDNGKVYSEAVARQMLAACRSLAKQ
jgi:hypothetical protein